VEMDFINPNRLSLVVDRRVRLRLPVEPTFIGQPPDGYAFYGAEVKPQKLVVEGPEAELSQIESLATTPLRLDRLTQPVEMTAVAITQGPHVRIADPEPVKVRVIVDAAPIERRFDGVPVQVAGRPATVSPPGTVSVTLAGPPYLLESLRPENIVARVDAAELAPGRHHKVDVTVEYRDVPPEEQTRITVNAIEPAKVEVRVQQEETQS